MATEAERVRAGRLLPISLEKVPWWGLILAVLGLLTVYSMFTSETYRDTFAFLRDGLKFTILITVVSFSLALVLGLITGLGRVSKNLLFYTISTLYVEVVRGIPILVQLIYVAFVLVPMGIHLLNGLGGFILKYQMSWQPLTRLALSLKSLDIKNVNMVVRGMLGMTIAYGAFEAEVFRAGIQSIEKGQMEAARSLGMTYFQAMRYIILPQAIRRILPPLGNDFIAMLKDSSLLSALAVRELTQLGKLNRARTFRTFETWNTVALLYLMMTLLLSLLVKVMERRMSLERE